MLLIVAILHLIILVGPSTVQIPATTPHTVPGEYFFLFCCISHLPHFLIFFIDYSIYRPAVPETATPIIGDGTTRKRKAECMFYLCTYC
jgi:hypothetical protein